MLRTNKKTINIASSATYSEWFEVPNWSTFCMVYIPDIDSGNVGLELTIDGGTTYAPILKADGTADLVIAASGTDPCIVDISDYLRSVVDYDTHSVQLRFTCAAQNSGAVNCIAYFKE